MSLVSIIIPNYNHALFLNKRIESVINQSYKNIEIIILDDCSSDNSREIIIEYAQKDNRIQIVFNENNSGSTFKQWNKGVKIAKGEYIWIAESDDFAELDFIEKLLPILVQNNNVSLVCANTNSIDKNDNIIQKGHNVVAEFEKELFGENQKITIFYSKYFIENLLIQRCVMPNVSAVLMRKQYYLTVGFANEDFKLAGDYELYYKISKISNIAFYNEYLNFCRFHVDKTSTNHTFKSFTEIIEVIIMIVFENNISNEILKKTNDFYFTVFKYTFLMKKSVFNHEMVKLINKIKKIDKSIYLKILKYKKERIKINLGKILKRNRKLN